MEVGRGRSRRRISGAIFSTAAKTHSNAVCHRSMARHSSITRAAVCRAASSNAHRLHHQPPSLRWPWASVSWSMTNKHGQGSASGKSGKGAAAPRNTRDERIDAAMREAARFAGAQLKRQGLKLPKGKWSDAAPVRWSRAGNCARTAGWRPSRAGAAPAKLSKSRSPGPKSGREQPCQVAECCESGPVAVRCLGPICSGQVLPAGGLDSRMRPVATAPEAC